MATSPKLITEDGSPVSHFSLTAVQHEAHEEPFVFDIDGEFFTMQPPEDADWQVTGNITGDGGLQAFVQEIMDADDWERFSAIKLTNKQIGDLLEACRKHYGTSPGESRASRRSSRSSRRR
ncbi:hypothetical protein [Acrocarpospora sp. B8E8]|uniref:hypothetical protein n=1 Tax=Acrocarpospora sp. B8E8 TaxID=3153572 RepID=UPI00325D8A2A